MLKFQRMKLNGGGTKTSYTRLVVGVGDAKGFFGTACGFGKNINQALQNGVVKVRLMG